jgi:hypothetical protein
MKFVEGEGKNAKLTPAGKMLFTIIALILFGPPLFIALIKLNVYLWSL